MDGGKGTDGITACDVVVQALGRIETGLIEEFPKVSSLESSARVVTHWNEDYYQRVLDIARKRNTIPNLDIGTILWKSQRSMAEPIVMINSTSKFSARRIL